MNEEIKNQEEEISLIDLFAVLLRYRKIIICITLVSVVLAIAGYFIYPAHQYKNVSQESKYQARALFTVKHQALPYITVSLEKLIKDSDTVLNSLRDTGIDTFQGISLADETARSRVLFLIDRWIETGSEENASNGRFKITALSTSASTPAPAPASAVEVFFIYKNIEQVKLFIQSLFIRSNQKIIDYLRSDMEAIVQNYERLRDIPNGSQAVQQFLAENITQYSFIKNVLDRKESMLVQIGEPVITEEAPQFSLATFRNAYIMKGIVIVFAGLFIAVFLAFALNAVENIKKDEETMKKIRGALKGSAVK